MKIAIISDTHQKHLKLNMPNADMIICCGDVSYNEYTLNAFLKWFALLDYKYKILIAGNHDVFIEKIGREKTKELCSSYDKKIIYLEDEEVVVEGIKFYGTPWTPIFRHWHFMASEEELEEKWKLIPEDVEVLITHGPQHGVLDTIKKRNGYVYLGSRSLSRRILELKKLNYHFFGHIHPEAGIKEKNEFRHYVSVNASSAYDITQELNGVREEPVLIEI